MRYVVVLNNLLLRVLLFCVIFGYVVYLWCGRFSGVIFMGVFLVDVVVVVDNKFNV